MCKGIKTRLSQVDETREAHDGAVDPAKRPEPEDFGRIVTRTSRIVSALLGRKKKEATRYVAGVTYETAE